VTEERTWRDTAGRVGIPLFIADGLAYVGKVIAFRSLYEKHTDVLVIWDWIGLAVSVLALILAAIGMRKKLSIIISTASVVLAYLWFSAIAWLVMVK
jgi:hypothetical protein